MKSQELKNLSEEERRLLLTRCYLNPVLWFEKVLGLTIKPFHKEWIEILFKNNRIAISAPTGFGKTSVFGIGYPLWLAYYKPRSKSLIISKTIRTQSSNVLEEIKYHIDNNPILMQLKPTDNSEWSKEKIICSNGSQIFYSSYSANVRGAHVDYLFADEVSTYMDDIIFYRDVSTRVDSKKGKLAAVSTPINTTDLLAQLINNKTYVSRVYPAVVNNESIWPERYPMEWMKNKRKEIGNSQFERNYMVNPHAESESPIFSLSSIEDCYDLHRCLTDDLDSDKNQVYIGVDLAISTGTRADYDVYTATEIDKDKIIIKKVLRAKGLPIEAKIERLKQMYDIFKNKASYVKFIIDESNIGHAIIDALRREGIPTEGQSFNSAARSQLLTNLKSIIESKRLIIPRNFEDPYTITFTNKLTEELIAFKEKESRLTRIKHLVSDAAHDDTVMSLALACKGAITRRPFEDYIASAND